mgnify:CR=1 FL=1
MAHATYPSVFWDNSSNAYKCEMRDKKTGQAWGHGYGITRNEAIRNARHNQPKDPVVKRAIGWVSHHPFIAGAAVGCYLQYRHARYHQDELRPADYLVAAIMMGTIVWAAVKVFDWLMEP